MQRHTLEPDCDEDFLLLAIHCNIEEHKLAFLINKHFDLKLKRRERDLDIFTKEGNITYPIFEYIDPKNEEFYYLVSNSFKTVIQTTTSAGSLFETDVEEKIYYLIPEYKRADYILKIETDDIINIEARLLPQLTKLPHLVTAYILDYKKLKSRTNLNFDSCH